MRYLSVVAVLLLSACAGTQISNFTHADIQNAIKLDNAAGYPERGAVWAANDALLTAWENQIAACVAAVKAGVPSAPSGTVGAATLYESAALGIISLSDARAKALCEPLPLLSLPAFPKL